jgi:hypothetical protein
MFSAVLRIRDVYLGSRILIFVHPGSWIPNPKTKTKRAVKKINRSTFFVATNFHKIESYENFELVKKKIWASLQRIEEL